MAMDRIRSTYEVSVKRGSITAEQVEERMARITPVTSYSDLGDCDMVIEAVFERMDVKIPVFKQLDQSMKQGAILATNSSALDIDGIAAATNRPESVIGTHFFSPANVMKRLRSSAARKPQKKSSHPASGSHSRSPRLAWYAEIATASSRTAAGCPLTSR